MSPDQTHANRAGPATGQLAAPTAPNVRALKFSIRSKMILLSTLLLVAAIGVFGLINARQARKNIDNYSNTLRRTITESLNQAGQAQLSLLASAARIALLQNDYGSLKTIIRDVTKQDARITKVSVFDPDGRLIDNSGDEISPTSFVEGLRQTNRPTTTSEVLVGSQRSRIFARPVKYKDRLICIALIAYSLKPLETELDKAAETKRQTAATNLRNILVVGVMAGFLGILLTILQGMRISRPIRALAQQANRLAEGDFNARVHIASHDEIGQLGDTFNHMSHQIVSLMDEAQTKAAMEREFEIANSIQASLIPASTTVSLKGMEITGFFQPASQCGGDWWHYYEMPGNKALIIIGDVTGHGVPSAMITALVKGAASTMTSVVGSFGVDELLKQLNEVVYDAGGRQFFMTCFVALFDATSRTLTYANAGHTMPYVYRVGTKQLESLMSRGTWLGYEPSPTFGISTTQLEKGDVVVWYTDGIPELEKADGRMLGERRFRRLLLKHMGLPLAELQDKVVADVYSFAEGYPQEDDITLVVGRVCS